MQPTTDIRIASIIPEPHSTRAAQTQSKPAFHRHPQYSAYNGLGESQYTMMARMDDPLDKTTLATISLLESRLLRIEHLLYGTTASPFSNQNQHETAIQKMDALERRFTRMTSQIRVYAELLKICQCSFLAPNHPPLFYTGASSLTSFRHYRQVQSRPLPRASSLPTALAARLKRRPIHRPFLRILLPRHALRPHRRQGHPHTRLLHQRQPDLAHQADEGH